MRKNVVYLLGKKENQSLQNLKAESRRLYTNMPATDVDLATETLLLELDECGVTQIYAGNRIMLTELGKSEHKSAAAQVELKQRKRAQRSELKHRRLVMKEEKACSKSIHEKLKLQLGQLAFLLGKAWKQEHQLVKGGPVILDFVWYANPQKPKISHAFEVQHRGGWKNAIGNLEAARRYYPDCKLFLVVRNIRSNISR